MSRYSPFQFGMFRIVLGSYLTVHFAMLIPWAGELWSNAGMLSDPTLNFTNGLLPNLLNWVNAPGFATGFVVVLMVLSLLLTIGVQRPVVAVLLWYGWACLLDRNNFISNPGIPYIGWLLLACAVIPKGEPLSVSKRNPGWEFPALLFGGAWALMAVGYSISGFDKLLAPSWQDGTAVLHLLENPLARATMLRELLVGMPSGVHATMTYTILAGELLFLPLALFRKTRAIAWCGMILMHAGILTLVDFADLTTGMVMIHLLTLDPAWLKPARKTNTPQIVYFDGVCGLCNNFIDFLFEEDRHNILQFTPIQGETAANNFPEGELQQFDSIGFAENGKLYFKSTAALMILSRIGGIWKLAVLFRIIPRPLRDFVYDIVAANRYKWFGKHETCRMPTPEERAKLLP